MLIQNMIVRYILFFLVSISVQAQKILKAGSYTNQVFTQAVVLDTGSFVFKDVAFKLPIKHFKRAALVDGRKAKSVGMENCKFTGKQTEIGLLTGQGISKLIHCQFENLAIGIESQGSKNEKTTLSMQSTNFLDCSLAGVAASHTAVVAGNCKISFTKMPKPPHKNPSSFAKEMLAGAGGSTANPAYPYGFFFENGTAGSLTLTGSNNFEGPFDVVNAISPAYTDLTGTAIRLAGQNFNLIGARISKWRTGILVRETTAVPIISQNRFFGNQTAIYLSPLAGNTIDNMNLNLRCNRFDHRFIEILNTTTPSEDYTEFTGNATGLRIGPGATIANNRIGGDGEAPTNFENPNSNYWPRIGTGLNTNPVPGFTSVLNASDNPIDYWAYENEFLGTVFPAQTSGLPNRVFRQFLNNVITVKPSDIQTHCNANYLNCGYSDVPDCVESISDNLATYDPACTNNRTWRLACTDGGVFDFVSFPIARPAPTDTSLQAIVKVQETLYGELPYLGQSIPNPGSDKITIPLFVPLASEGAKLLILETATGRKIHQQDLALGAQFINLSVQTWAAGIYTYQMLLPTGQPPRAQKMVILH